MSLDYDYRYVSTEQRSAYLKKHAGPEVYAAYAKLNDGAAQADLWRLVVLNTEGGIYLDIDATLVCPLSKVLRNVKEALYLWVPHRRVYTNYFLASAPNNPVFIEAIRRIQENIEMGSVSEGVYNMSGPGVITEVLEEKNFFSKISKHVCIQGAFTNEYFQYLDKPGSKWIHKKPEDILK